MRSVDRYRGILTSNDHCVGARPLYRCFEPVMVIPS